MSESALQDLYNKLEKDSKHLKIAKEATQLIRGDGPVGAKLLFIGEAPGKKEDERGRPFVGASGKLLDELLASIDISRSEVYITNIVKFRPTNNRDPSLQEKKFFLPYLLEEIDIIKPKLIVTLGRHSMNEFLPNATIGAVHGTLQQTEEGLSILPLYHPAAAMYNGSLRQTLFEDMQTIRSYI